MLSALALISLAVSVLFCVYVLLPKQVFEFSLNAPQVYEALFEIRDDEEEVRRRLAYWLEEFWQRNQDRIDELGRYFFAAAVALILQLIFWAFALKHQNWSGDCRNASHHHHWRQYAGVGATRGFRTREQHHRSRPKGSRRLVLVPH